MPGRKVRHFHQSRLRATIAHFYRIGWSGFGRFVRGTQSSPAATGETFGVRPLPMSNSWKRRNLLAGLWRDSASNIKRRPLPTSFLQFVELLQHRYHSANMCVSRALRLSFSFGSIKFVVKGIEYWNCLAGDSHELGVAEQLVGYAFEVRSGVKASGGEGGIRIRLRS